MAVSFCADDAQFVAGFVSDLLFDRDITWPLDLKTITAWASDMDDDENTLVVAVLAALGYDGGDWDSSETIEVTEQHIVNALVSLGEWDSLLEEAEAEMNKAQGNEFRRDHYELITRHWHLQALSEAYVRRAA